MSPSRALSFSVAPATARETLARPTQARARDHCAHLRLESHPLRIRGEPCPLPSLRPSSSSSNASTSCTPASTGSARRAAERLGESRRKHVENDQERSQRDARPTCTASASPSSTPSRRACASGGSTTSASDEPMYLGRIGIHTEGGEQLLVDWRSEAGRRFYLATAASPAGVRRRRHLHTKGRRLRSGGTTRSWTWTPRASRDLDDRLRRGAHPSVLRRGPHQRVQDIVATIQAEQDRIIRAPLEGVMIVDGAPGTGKTAVALHRAAYLLYEHREQLKRQRRAHHRPRHAASCATSPRSCRAWPRPTCCCARPRSSSRASSPTGPRPRPWPPIKGRAVMAGVIASAVADRQVVPREPRAGGLRGPRAVPAAGEDHGGPGRGARDGPAAQRGPRDLPQAGDRRPRDPVRGHHRRGARSAGRTCWAWPTGRSSRSRSPLTR